MLSVLLLSSVALLANAEGLPSAVQAKLIGKLVNFEKGISDKGKASIFVVGDNELAEQLSRFAGKRLGRVELTSVDSASQPPSTAYDVIYIGNDADVTSAIQYAREHNALTLTGNTSWVDQGISVGLAVEAGKPKILLNLSAAKAEGVDWNPAVLKIASTQ
jgi:hypothetical protein|tara:strand:+ start:1686 stop:2168 length:483 start_codon:yes stop_codon:yes gene_type:complete